MRDYSFIMNITTFVLYSVKIYYSYIYLCEMKKFWFTMQLYCLIYASSIVVLILVDDLKTSQL